MNLPIRARPSIQTYLVFSCLFGTPLLLCAIGTIRQHSMWGGIVLCLLGFGFVFAWLLNYQVTVEGDKLEYKTLLHTRRTVRLSDVKTAEVEIGYPRYRDRLKPPVRLVVRYLKDGHAKDICINLKVFSKSDVEQLLLALKVT